MKCIILYGRKVLPFGGENICAYWGTEKNSAEPKNPQEHGIPGSCNDAAGRAYEKIMLINEGGISER